MKRILIVLLFPAVLISCSNREPSYDALMKENGRLKEKIAELNLNISDQKMLQEEIREELQETIDTAKEGMNNILGYLKKIILEIPNPDENHVGIQWVVFENSFGRKNVYLHIFDSNRNSFINVPIWGNLLYHLYYNKGKTPDIKKFDNS